MPRKKAPCAREAPLSGGRIPRLQSAFGFGSISIAGVTGTNLPPDFHAARGHGAVGSVRMKCVHASSRMASVGDRPPKSYRSVPPCPAN